MNRAGAVLLKFWLLVKGGKRLNEKQAGEVFGAMNVFAGFWAYPNRLLDLRSLGVTAERLLQLPFSTWRSYLEITPAACLRTHLEIFGIPQPGNARVAVCLVCAEALLMCWMSQIREKNPSLKPRASAKTAALLLPACRLSWPLRQPPVQGARTIRLAPPRVQALPLPCLLLLRRLRLRNQRSCLIGSVAVQRCTRACASIEQAGRCC
jgi:hypothetical protein